ncbi:hypothetical protein ACLOJK_034641 [Asimina triloba]
MFEMMEALDRWEFGRFGIANGRRRWRMGADDGAWLDRALLLVMEASDRPSPSFGRDADRVARGLL